MREQIAMYIMTNKLDGVLYVGVEMIHKSRHPYRIRCEDLMSIKKEDRIWKLG